MRCASDPVAISQSWSSSSGRASAGGDTVTVGSVTDGRLYQSVNVGSTAAFDFSVYVYDNTAGNVGGIVSSSIASLYYGGNTITNPQYTPVLGEAGWYKLTATITGLASSVDSGLLVKAGKTVKVDDFTLSRQGTYSVYTTTAYNNAQVKSWDSFSASQTASGNASVVYQICLDDGSACGYAAGSRWQYYTAGAWTNSTDATAAYANTASQLTAAAMQALAVASQKISVKAIMGFGGVDTPSLASFSVGLTTDTTSPSLTLTSLSPDPTTNTTPTFTGTASDSQSNIASVQFQMDATTGSWTACTADDGVFNSASENFTCAVSPALSDGTHTIYVRATDSNGNTTASGSEATDTFVVDTTAPVSFALDSPGDNTYTNSERPTFRWKATTDATSGLVQYSLEIDNGDTGDFTIDDIPLSRTTDYETSKYTVHYESGYISISTKSSQDWSSDYNNAKLKEGKRTWKVKARDNAGNERLESSTFFVDHSGPGVEITQVNDAAYKDNLGTNDQTPTIFGKITDSLAGDRTDHKVAAGPKSVEVKIEKKNLLGTYELHSLATINLTENYWTSDGSKITDNSKQTSNKYSTFSFTPDTNLPLGDYKITLTGKDKADNTGGATSFNLSVTTFARLVTPEEEKIIEKTIEEELPEATKEEKEKIKEELEIVKLMPPKEISFLERITSKLANLTIKTYWKIVDRTKTTVNVLAYGWGKYSQFTRETQQKTLAFTSSKLGQAATVAKDTTTRTLAFVFEKTGQGLVFAGEQYNLLAQKAPGVVGKTMLALKDGASNINSGIGKTGKQIVNVVGSTTGNTTKAIAQVMKPITSKVVAAFGNTGRTAGEFLATTGKDVKVKLAGTYVIWFDKEPTRITEVKVVETGKDYAVIFWKTNHYTRNNKVNYGETLAYGEHAFGPDKKKEHQVKITGLKPGIKYVFEVMSQNKNYIYDSFHEFTTRF